MKKKSLIFFNIILFIILVLIIIFYIKKSFNIISIGSGFETIYIEWKDEKNYSNYNVYYKKIEDENYKKIDSQLIRNYKDDFWRADIVGLKEGEYQLKIIPVIEEKEKRFSLIITDKIYVKQNIREGFCSSSGGYLADGSLPKDSNVIYVTKENVNKVSLDITNENGDKEKIIGLSNILQNWNREKASKHLVIRILGKLEEKDIEGLHSEYKSIQIKNCSNLTIEGIGNNATLKGVGIILEDSSNIEIRNLGIMLYIEDGISLEKNNKNIWIHNNDFFYGKEESKEENKLKGDGAIDIKDSRNITISYNHFWDNGKTSLCGLNNDVDFVTYHHNWFDHCDSRCPRVAYSSVHCYNNYYDGIIKYGIGTVEGASVFSESNYFRNVKRPMLISNQSSDTSNILDGNSGGIIKSYNDLIEWKGYRGMLVSYLDDKTEFDCYMVSNRYIKVPESVKTVIDGYTYNNFDTDGNVMYYYNPDDVNDVEKIVTKNSGRLQGGDIDFDTSRLSDNSDSRLNSVEKQLDNLILNY